MGRIERPVLIALTAPGFEIKLSAVPPRDLDMLFGLGIRAGRGEGSGEACCGLGLRVSFVFSRGLIS